MYAAGGPRPHNTRPRPIRAASAGPWVPGHVVRPAGGSVRYSLGARPTSRACLVLSSAKPAAGAHSQGGGGRHGTPRYVLRTYPVSLHYCHSAASWVMPCINSPAGLKLPGYASRLPPLVPYGTLYKKERRRGSVTSPVCIPNKPLIGSKPIRASIGHANMLMQSNKPCMPP